MALNIFKNKGRDPYLMTNLIKEHFKAEQLKSLKLIFPKIPEKVLSKIIDKKVEEKFLDNTCEIYNNYREVKQVTTLSKVYDYINEKKPILTEQGVLFKQHSEEINPAAEMLKSFKENRKKAKKAMYEASSDTEKKFHDLRQKTFKLFMNSYFGVCGQSSSQFYNLFTALSITGKGRSLICNAINTYERFIGNFIFNNIDECIQYISKIINEDYIIDNLIDNNISKENLLNLLSSKFINDINKNELVILNKVINNLSQKDVNKIFYKNNFYTFVLNTKIKKIIKELFSIKDDFLYAGNPPESMIKLLEEFWSILKENVYYRYEAYNRIELAKVIKRNIVTIVDTDSNFLAMNIWKEIVKEDILKVDEIDEKETYKIVNIAVYVLTQMIKDALKLFASNCNIQDEDYHKWLAMKNEFYCRRLVLTSGMRNYMSYNTMQEGKILNPPELSIRGLPFKKVSVNKNLRKKFKDLSTKILTDKEIKLNEIVDEIFLIKEEIFNSLINGEIEYLKPSSCKSIDAYKNPYSMQQFRAVYNFNKFYPEQEIHLPEKIYIIKLRSDNLETLKQLIKDKETYNKIVELIFKDNNINKFGFDVFGIPKDYKQVPEWIRPLIDIDSIVADSFKPYRSILESLGLEVIFGLKSGDPSISNIISFY